MPVRSTILLLLTTVVVVSSAGFLGEQDQLRSRGNVSRGYPYGCERLPAPLEHLERSESGVKIEARSSGEKVRGTRVNKSTLVA